MGQKVHPLGFRLNTTQKHKSIWYSSLNNYAILLEQDAQIRNFIIEHFNSAGIVEIEMERMYKLNCVALKVYVAIPQIIVGESGSVILDLSQKLTKRLKFINRIIIDVFEVLEQDSYATLLAQFIGKKLVSRVAFKRAVREAIKRARAKNIKGIKVQISGRLNGAEIARSTWVKEGQMPLQTLRAEIDYATTIAKTIYGIIGIKVWLFKG